MAELFFAVVKIDAVDLATEEVAVAAGHAEHVACRADAGTGNPSRVDGVAHVLRDRLRRADVANGGDACFKRSARVLHGSQQALVLRRGRAERHRVRLAAHLQMRVCVDQPGCHARRLGVARTGSRPDSRDVFAFDDHVDVTLGVVERPVIENPGANDHVDSLPAIASSAWKALLVRPCPSFDAMKREAARTLSMSTPVSMPRPFNM